MSFFDICFDADWNNKAREDGKDLARDIVTIKTLEDEYNKN